MMKYKLPIASKSMSRLLRKFKDDGVKLYKDKLLAVILFGSCARGDFGNHSDIDILLLFDNTFQ